MDTTFASVYLLDWCLAAGISVITLSPPSRSGSTVSLRMLVSEYGQPKALETQRQRERENTWLNAEKKSYWFFLQQQQKQNNS